jgi:hypothetical protein
LKTKFNGCPVQWNSSGRRKFSGKAEIILLLIPACDIRRRGGIGLLWAALRSKPRELG